MALTPLCSNASAKRSSGTRRPTNCGSASGQRSRARSSELDCGEPVDPVRVDAAEDDAVLEDHVDAEDAAVELDRLLPAVEPEQAGDTAPAEHPDAVGHHLDVAGRLDDEVEAADVLPKRAQRLRLRRHVTRARGLHEPGTRIVRRAARRRPDVEPGEAEDVRREHPDRTGAEHEGALELPRLPAADRARVPDPALADRSRLHEHAETAERLRHADQLRRILAEELAGEPVQPRDPALAVVTREAGVGGALVARDAARAGAADDRRDEVAARVAVPVAVDDAEELVAEHEHVVARWGDAEEALGDLPVGAADTDLERA